jgi:glycosyltransferase involved in cell wall biosynthesis
MYYHLWDDYPAPQYNRDFYLSNDWMGCISKISKAMVEEVAPEFKENPWRIDYIPHGTPHDEFKQVDKSSVEYQKFIREYYKGEYEKYDFIIFYNNRNVRRKMMGDVMNAYDEFLSTLPQEKQDKCLLLMHTHVSDDNGTNLAALKNDLYPNHNILFSEAKVHTNILNFIYNSVDVTINLASNEGYGMATAESLMAGTPIIATITGGMQDQLGIPFENDFMSVDEWKVLQENGESFLTSHHAVGIIPKTRSLQGSPPTPYIYDDRISWIDAAHAIEYWYNKTPEERVKAGESGRQYLIENGHTVTEMNKRFRAAIKDIDENWEPIKRVNVIEC